ncbi:MAG: helix-turn-helix domain-containing protein [Actinobacteria bacterium]|nr:helix-turn-helix domain-containing protein [Actinomycetota bacterium]
MVSNGKNAAKKITRARILLKADTGSYGPGWKDEDIKEALDVGLNTIYRLRQRFVEEGLGCKEGFMPIHIRCYDKTVPRLNIVSLVEEVGVVLDWMDE